MSWWKRDDIREVDVVTGCFMLVRSEAIEQTGMMDKQFFIYGEETDWCYRFKQVGWKIIFTPDAEIVHLGGASSSQVKRRMYLQLRGSILLFFWKHRGRLAYWAACLLVALFFAVRVPYWLVRAIFSGQRQDNYLEKAHALIIGTGYAISGGNRLRQNYSRETKSVL